MNDVLASMLLLVAAYLLFRVLRGIFTGALAYKPRYQAERVVRFRGEPREFSVISLLFALIAIGCLWEAWSLLIPR